MSVKNNINQNATQYAEKYGIIDYIVKNSNMIYYANYPKYLNNKAYTVKATVNLLTMAETREQLNRYISKGNNNIYN